jgi:murein tripeptide amidase MpaA|eukprot:COSAG02_NODE_4077_length_5823_cov_2.618274_2_plen_106_part_00
MDPFRETETALRHLSSVHAASTRRANEIQESSAKVNDYATSEIRRSEYLSAVHCADSAAAMAMPPVLGLREAIDLTKRARGEISAIKSFTKRISERWKLPIAQVY